MTDMHASRSADNPPREGDRPTQTEPSRPTLPPLPPPTFPNGPRGPRYLPGMSEHAGWSAETVTGIAFYGLDLPAYEPVGGVR